MSPPAAAAPACWVYVAGVGRSGSTLLAVLLARATGALNCGELCRLWARLDEGGRCECGAELAACPVWGPVRDDVRAAIGPRFEAATRALSAPPSLAAKLVRRRPGPEQVALRAATEEAVERVTGARLVLDASKRVSVLRTAIGRPRPLVVVHLVRDPRGVAHSSRRAKALPLASGVTLPARQAWKTSALWNTTNARIDRTLRHSAGPAPLAAVQLTYEALAADPEAAVARVVDALPAGAVARAGPGRGSVEGHGIAGNAALYRDRPVVPDQRWESELPRRERLLVGALTFPGRRRYRHPLRPPAAAPGTSRASRPGAAQPTPGAAR